MLEQVQALPVYRNTRLRATRYCRWFLAWCRIQR